MKTLQNMPEKLNTMTRTASYGSWFNFYLCNFDGNVTLPTGHAASRSAYDNQLGEVRQDDSPFREQNQVTVGAVGLTVIGLVMLAAFKAQDLPLIGGGTKYSAQFSEAGGLKPNDEIRVAGVRVGQVREVELEGDHVRVDFVVDKGVKLGDQTGAEMKIKTLLGAEVPELNPAGAGQLKAGSRSRWPGRSRRTTSWTRSAISPTPPSGSTPPSWPRRWTRCRRRSRTRPKRSRPSLTGLSRLSRNVAKRDEQLSCCCSTRTWSPRSLPTATSS